MAVSDCPLVGAYVAETGTNVEPSKSLATTTERQERAAPTAQRSWWVIIRCRRCRGHQRSPGVRPRTAGHSAFRGRRTDRLHRYRGVSHAVVVVAVLVVGVGLLVIVLRRLANRT